MSIVPTLGTISFARGVPSPEMFPAELLAEAASLAAREDAAVAFNYGSAGGYEPLRELLAENHACDPAAVLLTPGSLIALNLILEQSREWRSLVIVEAPTYDRVLRSIRDLGIQSECVTRDRSGRLDFDALRKIASSAKGKAMFYCIPTFHNPTGTTLNHTDRQELATLADEFDLTVVEDDPYGLLRFDGTRSEPMHSILRQRGRGDLAAYCSSFSKIVAPGLRVGYAILPNGLRESVERLAARTYLSPPLFPQAQLFKFLEAGHLDAHLERVRELLRVRRDALVAGLEEGMPEGATWTSPDGGYFLWLELPGELDASVLQELALAEGVDFVAGSAFSEHAPRNNTARLSFSYPTAAEITEGMRRLTQVIRSAVDIPG
jgi:2-aminoadipate transaminase